jgi:hypothetical protein
MKEDILKIGGILVAAFLIIYLVIKMFHIQPIREGLENAPSLTNTTPSLSGAAGSAANYAAGIKAKTVQIQDAVLISKYRKDYESVIINMEDYLSILMLEQLLSMNVADDVKTTIQKIEAINILSTGKKSLNELMVYVDKQ